MKNNTQEQEDKPYLLNLYSRFADHDIQINLTEDESEYIMEELDKIETQDYKEIVTVCGVYYQSTFNDIPVDEHLEDFYLITDQQESRDIITSLLTQYHTTQNKANAKDEK